MSSRFVGQNKNDHRSSAKPQKKFVPKRDYNPNDSPQTLSNSLRSTSPGATTTLDAAVASSSRVRMGGDGEWVKKASTSGNFVIYLPQDEAVAAGLGPEEGGLDPVESQRVVDLLNRELSRLLKLNPRDFWREVATDDSLNAFLESFLKFRNRWYDFPHRGARGKVAGVIVGEFELCRRVFMILYRLSSNRDPGARAADTLSAKDHEALLQDKKMLDLPRLLDICAIYGHENEDLTRILVMNAMKAQPYIHGGFLALITHFLSIVQTMHQRCSTSLEVLLSSGGHQDHGTNHLQIDYLEVMDFINDSVVSLDSFVNAYQHAAVFFSSPIEMSYGNEELLSALARLHDSLLPSLLKGFCSILGVVEDRNKKISHDLLSNVFTSLKMLSKRIANFGWKLLHLCYLSDEVFQDNYSLPVSMKMFPANVEDPVIRADILIQTIRDLTGEQTHGQGCQNMGTFIQEIEKNHKVMSRIELLRNSGWISMDDEQLQFLSVITRTSLKADIKVTPTSSFPTSTNKKQSDEDVAIIESKISQIKELFPDYGRGFLVACLEAYNNDTEEVIQRILEGTLHEELQSLDISLEAIQLTESASAMSRNDKGKGKLIESAVSPPDVVGPTVVKNQAAVSLGSSSSSVGRFMRKNTNDLSDSEILNAKREKELTKTSALASQFEYEDEYDDSFDDLGLSVGDSGLEESETLEDRTDNSHRGRFPEGDGGSSTSNTDNSKWNSRKTPQFYVKDGKNYSYKVAGSVAVANYNESRLVNQAQQKLIHGLGKGGNIPLGAVKSLTGSKEEQHDEQGTDEVGRGGRGSGRGRGRRGGGRWFAESTEDKEEGVENNEVGGRGGRGGYPRGGGRRGGGRNTFRKDRAMSKHLSGLPNHYN
ncbi:hypothetical protein ACS0TY_023659 [Phlomoides rotata]